GGAARGQGPPRRRQPLRAADRHVSRQASRQGRRRPPRRHRGPHRPLVAMCTIILLRHVHPTIPTIVAANRDEFYARAAHPPHLLSRAPRVLAGLDVERVNAARLVTRIWVCWGLTLRPLLLNTPVTSPT